MTTTHIDETAKAGQRVLREPRENSSARAIYEVPRYEPATLDAEPVKIARAPRDENGNIIGYLWEEVLEDMYEDLSKHYGVDLRTL
jgi:hypothetical protein